MKKGKIEIIEEYMVRMLNLDGQCREMLAVSPEQARNIKDNIGLEEEVFYFLEGNKLVYIDLVKRNADLHDLHEILLKETECLAPT